MYVKLTKINPNIRKKDLIQLLTLDSPIYKIKEVTDGLLIMYSTLSQLQLCSEFNGLELVDPLQIEYIELLVPVNPPKSSHKAKCVCFVSNLYLEIEEIERISLPILLYVYKSIAGKHFYIVEFEQEFNFSTTSGFYAIFTFTDYLDHLAYSGKI